jgi:hypothetical protein
MSGIAFATWKSTPDGALWMREDGTAGGLWNVTPN